MSDVMPWPEIYELMDAAAESERLTGWERGFLANLLASPGPRRSDGMPKFRVSPKQNAVLVRIRRKVHGS